MNIIYLGISILAQITNSKESYENSAMRIAAGALLKPSSEPGSAERSSGP